MIKYGFQRLVLLGSAGYQRAELPLDDSVSLIAPNNTGKTSLINALQFMLIIDKRRMDFGAHEFDKTRRFYFPNNSAYILLEVTLPQTGTVVFGCVGKGVSHEYEYFAYKGELDIEDFRLDKGTLVQQPDLIQHLASRQRSAYRYSSSEFAAQIYGGSGRSRRSDTDFTVFKLENASDAQAFQQVLTRTLRLDKLSSNEVKKYLLQIFKRDLPDANIDFKQEWDKAFHEVNKDKEQYQAAADNLSSIQRLEEKYQQRLQIRGKLIVWRPLIEQGLEQWHAHYQQNQSEINNAILEVKNQLNGILQRDREITAERLEHQRQYTELQQASQRCETLKNQYALVNNRQVLETALNDAEQKLEQQITLIGQSSARDTNSIEREIRQQTQLQNELQSQLNNCHNNLYLTLKSELTENQLSQLNKVLNRQIMTLPPEQFLLDIERLKSLLQSHEPAQLNLPGLTLFLTNLKEQYQSLSPQQLTEQIADAKNRLDSLYQQLETAKSLDQARQIKQQLQAEKTSCEEDLKHYDELQQLLKTAAERAEQLKNTQQKIQALEAEQTNANQYHQQLQQNLNQQQYELSQLQAADKSIQNLKNQRLDLSEEFAYLADLPHQEWLAEADWSLNDFAEKLKQYQNDCTLLQQLNDSLSSGLRQLHSFGLTKYQFSENPDQELARIIGFSHQLPQEKLALEKKARSAVVNVTASLRELRDGLLSFQGKMREFNRLIGHRQLSDLKTFKIDAVNQDFLVEAIETLITTAEQVDTGDSFDLFNQSSVLDDDALDRARQTLIDEGNARQGLKVADLFRLEFVVGKQGQQAESFEDIDSAASNGTVLMAKLVTGLAMLYLMQDKRHQMNAICYLDEALALDGRNQASLIETAKEFAYSLIFASPAPLTTVRYCVPIYNHNGNNHISRESWQILEPLAEYELSKKGSLL